MNKDSQEIEEIKRVIIIASVAAQVLHEALDDLSETSYYKQSLKMTLNKLQTEITKACDDQTNALFAADSTSMMELQVGIVEVAKQVVGSTPTTIAAMGELLKKKPNALGEVEEISELKQEEVLT